MINPKIQSHLEKIEITLDAALSITTCLGVLVENWYGEDITAVNYTEAIFASQLKNTTLKAAISKLRTMYKSHMKLSPGCYCYRGMLSVVQDMQWYCKKNNYHNLWH